LKVPQACAASLAEAKTAGATATSALAVDVEEYVTLHDEIVNLMSLFRNQIENAAVTRGYLIPR